MDGGMEHPIIREKDVKMKPCEESEGRNCKVKMCDKGKKQVWRLHRKQAMRAVRVSVPE